jgi:hypothetical protein
MKHQQTHYSVMYAYYHLHSSYMFRRYYLAIFREMTLEFLAWTGLQWDFFTFTCENPRSESHSSSSS